MKVSDSASDDDLLTAASAFIIMLHASKNDRKEKKKAVVDDIPVPKQKSLQGQRSQLWPGEGARVWSLWEFLPSDNIRFWTPCGKNRSQNYETEILLRESIPAQECLMITFRFLATGDSYSSLMYTFKMSKQLISKILKKCVVLPFHHFKILTLSTLGE